jgi:hypothetical protein
MYLVPNKICKNNLLPLICDILIIKHSSKISAWILLFSLVCFSPLLVGKFRDFQMTQNRLKNYYDLIKNKTVLTYFQKCYAVEELLGSGKHGYRLGCLNENVRLISIQFRQYQYSFSKMIAYN